jgi:glycosyltransferase involved in cell wall biosynthesis
MGPTVSVVIPTYNRLGYLREALSSALTQSRPPDEVIIVDDGSTDGTGATMSAMPPPVRYIRQQNAGPAAARNRGLREARSEWIALLDSDDLWTPGKLAAQLDFIERNPAIDFIFGTQVNQKDGVRDQEPEIIDHAVYRQLEASAEAVPDFFRLLLRNNPIPTSSVFFRRDCLERVGFFEEQRWRCEDYELWFRFAHACRIGFINAVMVVKRQQGDNLINDYMKLWSAHLDVLRSLPTKFPELQLERDAQWKQAIAYTVYRLASFQLSRGDRDDARRWFQDLRYRDLSVLSGLPIIARLKGFLAALPMSPSRQCKLSKSRNSP